MNLPENTYEPLLQVLKKIQLWLSRDGITHLATMQSDFSAMQDAVLPMQMSVIERPMQGPRLVKRASRKNNPERTLLALWPEDALSEYAMPMLCFVLNGQADLRVADFILSCRSGDIIYFPAGIPKCNVSRTHLEGNLQGRACDLLWLHTYLHPRGMKCYICHSVQQNHLSALDGEHAFSQNSLIQQLFVEVCELIEKCGNQETIVRILELLVHLLQREIKEETLLPVPGLAQTLQSISPRPDSIHQACTYIDSHLKSPLTIAIVARQIFLSPSLFSRHFRRHTGLSFKAYLIRQRLKRAAHLLTDSDYSVEDIGRQVGLKASQLRALFHQHHGCSPVEFRKTQSKIESKIKK